MIRSNQSKNSPKDGEESTKKESLTRKDVLKAAAKLIRLHGYHGTSTQMIADVLGISKSTFFHHAKSKQDMLYEIINEPLQKLIPGIKEIYLQELHPVKKLKLAVINHISSLIENVEVVAVLLQERDCLGPPYSEIIHPKREEYVRIFRCIIEEGVVSGDFRDVDAKIAVYAILGMCNWLVQWYNPEGQVSPQAIAEMYADFAMRLLQPNNF